MSFFCQISVKQYFENIERENYNHLIIDNSVYYYVKQKTYIYFKCISQNFF